MIEFESGFDAFVAEGNCVVDFWGIGCGPCKIMRKTIEEIETLFPYVKFISVATSSNNVEINELCKKYNVKGLPTLLLFKEGELISEEHFMKKEDLINVLKEKFPNKISSEDTFKVCCIKGRKVKAPVRAHKTDAGIDFFAPLDMEYIRIEPHEDVVIKSGLRLNIPEGKALLGVNKSGVATKKKLVLGAKLIDSGYKDELGIHLINFSNEPVAVYPGDKIAQFILIDIGLNDVEMISEEEYEEKYTEGNRGGGFGSTGDK